MEDLRVAAVQFNHATADKAQNLDRIRAFAGAAARQDVKLLVFPGMCTGQRWLRGRRPELYDPLTARTGRELDPRSARFSKT